MSILPYKAQDGLEIFIDNTTGESFSSERGLARMCKKARTTVIYFLENTGRKTQAKKAEIITDEGLRSGLLYDEDTIVAALSKFNPELLIDFSKMGVRKAMHTLAGYNPTTEISEAEAIRQLATIGNRYANILDNIDNKPGLQRIIAALEQPKPVPLLPKENAVVYISVKKYLENYHPQKSRSLQRRIALRVAETYKTFYGKSAPKIDGCGINVYRAEDFAMIEAAVASTN
jgi:hypothetical protein